MLVPVDRKTEAAACDLVPHWIGSKKTHMVVSTGMLVPVDRKTGTAAGRGIFYPIGLGIRKRNQLTGIGENATERQEIDLGVGGVLGEDLR